METITFQLTKENKLWNAVNLHSHKIHARSSTKKETLARLLSSIHEECEVIVIDEKDKIVKNRIFRKNKLIKSEKAKTNKMPDTEENKIAFMKMRA